MSRIHSYPKVFAVGSDPIADLFRGPVEVTEKIDGSQFNFGVTKNGEIVMRSKGEEIYFENHPKLFAHAVRFVENAKDILLSFKKEVYFYSEYLGTPGHNILKYARVPKNNLVLFGVIEGERWLKSYEDLAAWAQRLDIEAVPLLFQGKIPTSEALEKLLETESVLGDNKVEGLVVKNYAITYFFGNVVWPSFGKFVREDFKERHAKEWNRRFDGKNDLQNFIDSFRTEARWAKAVQHLREQDKLVGEPKDIGPLLKELAEDLVAEEKETIKNGLYRLYIDQVIRKVQAGFPQWYREKLEKTK